MKTFLATTAMLLALAGGAAAQSVNIALDSNPDRERSGTYRYADNLMKALDAKGWSTEIFPRDTIGGEDERLDQIRAGILDLSQSNFSIATQFVPEMRVLQLPYTFENPEHEYAFLTESDFLDTVNEKLAPEGMMILAVVANGPFLGIFNNKKEVKTVEDMKGLRMRALDSNQLEMFQMMGASGVVIPFSEVPSAVQTGIADGYINPALVPLSQGQVDLFTNFTDARVIMSARLILASTAWWDGLSDDEKAAFQEASSEALREVFDWIDESDGKHKADLAANGIAVYEPGPEEIATFKEATANMADLLTDVPAERIAEIRAEVDEYAPQ